MPSRFVRAAAVLSQQQRRGGTDAALGWSGDTGLPNATRRDIWSACLPSHKSLRNSCEKQQLGRVRIDSHQTSKTSCRTNRRSPAAIYIHSRTCSLACTGYQPYLRLHQLSSVLKTTTHPPSTLRVAESTHNSNNNRELSIHTTWLSTCRETNERSASSMEHD